MDINKISGTRSPSDPSGPKKGPDPVSKAAQKKIKRSREQTEKQSSIKAGLEDAKSPGSTQGVVDNVFKATSSPGFIDPKQEMVASLKLYTEKREETSDPVEFFQEFEVNVDHFNPSDIEQLQNLFKKYKLSSGICFYDLFGLEFHRILSEAFLQNDTREMLASEWAALYFSGYIGILRSQAPYMPAISAATHIYFRMPSNYVVVLTDFGKKLQSAMQTYVQSLRKEEYKQKIVATMKQWLTLQLLVAKFANNNDSCGLFANHPVSWCPGSHHMDPESKEEALQTLKNLGLYCYIMHTSQQEARNRAQTSISLPFFKDVYQKIRSTGYRATAECLETLKEIPGDANSCMQTLGDLMVDYRQELIQAKDGSLTHEGWCKNHKTQVRRVKPQEEFVAFLEQCCVHAGLATSWASDIKQTIETAILPNLDPSYRAPNAYCNRVLINLMGMGFPEEEAIRFPIEQTLQEIKSTFTNLFESEEMINAINKLKDTMQTSGFIPLFVNPLFQQIHSLLKPIVDAALQRISAITPEDCGNVSLVEKTMWFSRILILFHDIEVLLEIQPPIEDNVLPESFLTFLNLNEDVLLSHEDATQSARVEEGISKPPASPVQEEAPIEKSKEVALRPSSVSSLQKDLFEKKEEIQKTEYKKPQPVMSEKEALEKEILHTRKRTQLERILKDLGFEKIRTKGSHATWKHKESPVKATLPQHGEIKTGTLRSIYHQVIGQDPTKETK